MGRIFINREGTWEAHPLGAEACLLLGPGGAHPVAGTDSEDAASPPWQARVCSHQLAGSTTEVLLLRSGVPARINGQPVVGQLAVLRDRSLLSIASQHYFYSSESPAVVEIFQPGESRILCPRCNGEVTEGEVVRCPGCRMYFHQSQERACFTYGETCSVCNTPTVLGEEGWNPAML